MTDVLQKALNEALDAHQALVAQASWQGVALDVVDRSVACLQAGGKVLFAGNGGSAADAQHLAAELSGRFYYDRPPLAAEALHCNTSFLTAVANDYSFEEVYSRLITAVGRPGDVFVALSTSGNSRNLVRALGTARQAGLVTVAMTGAGGGEMKSLCDFWLGAPTSDTPRVQECHILMGHILCQLVEARIFPRER